MARLDGKIAVITGGTQGLGAAIALQFAKAVQAVAPANGPRGKVIWNNNDEFFQHYADWSNAGFSDSGVNGLNFGDDITMMASAEAPSRTEMIFIGAADVSGKILAGVWNGSTWASVLSIPLSNPSAQASEVNSFAVAYDQVTGNAMLVWDNGSNTGNGLSYATWNGSTWSSIQTLNLPITGEPVHMQLAASPNSSAALAETGGHGQRVGARQALVDDRALLEENHPRRHRRADVGEDAAGDLLGLGEGHEACGDRRGPCGGARPRLPRRAGPVRRRRACSSASVKVPPRPRFTALPPAPPMRRRRHLAEARSLWNTAPTFAIYILMLVTKWLITDIGGLVKMEAQNRRKAKLLYDVIDESGGLYGGHAQKDVRSMMNVSFRLPSEEMTNKFVKGAEEQAMTDLKGHRSVGGIRASIYNAMPVEGVEKLRDSGIEQPDDLG